MKQSYLEGVKPTDVFIIKSPNVEDLIKEINIIENNDIGDLISTSNYIDFSVGETHNVYYAVLRRRNYHE